MKNCHEQGTKLRYCNLLKTAGGICVISACISVTPAAAADVSFFGRSDTIMRMQTTIDKKDIFPLYEYLRFSVSSTERDGSSTSLYVGGWGRADLGDKSSRDRSTDADLQYGYLSYQGARNNLQISAGRQFVAEGVATQRLDGLYVRSDLLAGFGAAVYVGTPAVTEPTLLADDLIFGGRITQGNTKYYTIGVSALKSFDESARYREEEGVDLWLHPLKQLDLTGRSSYNSITSGWMEHAYAVSYNPLDSLHISADLSNINYKDYFYRVTTSALVFNPLTNGIDPNEKLLALGANVSYALNNAFTVSGDYRHYDYDIAKNADYFGARLTYSVPGSYVAGASFHRMDGRQDKLKYNEYRLYASKELGKVDLTLDLIDINYDSTAGTNGVKNAVTVVAGGQYEFTKSVKLGASIDYSHNPLFDNEVKGLVKLTYLFDTKHTAEGGTK